MSALEHELRALAVDWPATPDLASAVEPRLVRAPRPWLRPLAVAAAAAVVAVGAALALSPGARSAILRFFHLRGATVERVERLPDVRDDAGRGLGLGALVQTADAEETVAFALRFPDGRRPERVRLDRSIGRGAVSVVSCCPRVIFMQFRGEAIPYVEKQAGPGTSIEYLTVGGGPGVWVAGRAHVVVFRDEHGDIADSPRLARNVLLWEDAGITYRLEGDFTKERALAIAASVR